MVNEPQEEFSCLPLYSCIVVEVIEEFRQKARICKKCHESFLQDAGGYTTICISCWIAMQKIDPKQKIEEMKRSEDNFAANIREHKTRHDSQGN